MEVVVVDDGSPAPLAEIVDPFQKQLNVKLVVQRQAGPAAARNAGAAHAHGQFLAFTDDDCAPESGWLNHLAKGLRQNPAAAVGGRTLNALDDNVYSAASQWLIDYMYDYYNAAQPAPKFFTSNNLALPAAAFRELGGFDTSFPLAAGEDRELCDRWRFRGGELLYVPDAIVLHSHSLNFSSFVRQHFNYGRGAFQFHLRCARRQQGTPRREPLSFYCNLLQSPLSRNRRVIRLLGLMVASQAATALGYCYDKFASEPPVHRNSET
jgi:GT2 family glycosyltransferase